MTKKENTTAATKQEKETPEAAQETQEYLPVSLETKQGSKTIGKPKSNKPWKKESGRAGKQTKVNPKSW